jgi:TolB-like protein/Tfp pilus assembly protein PilF
MPYLFDGYVLDAGRRELRKGDILQAVEPQVFDLLQYLIANRDRVVSRDEMFAAIWKGRIVSDSALSSRINAARTALGDSGDKQRLIRTLLRKGVRFVGDVRETDGAASTASAAALVEGPPVVGAHAPETASIVVLPFHNLSDDPKQEYFVDGVTESLTTDLSRIVGLRVIARNTAFTFKGKAIDVKQIGHELNVRYVLEGSVQHGGNRLRVNVQLIDAATATHLWADRFEQSVADLFDMQDEIVSRLANALDAQLIAAEARRAEGSPHPTSMELYFQGKALLQKGWTPEYLAQARKILEHALALDPNNVEAMAWMATVDVIVGSSYLTDDRAAHLAAAEATSVKALSLAPGHAFAHLMLGFVLNATKRVDRAMAEFERALALDRNLAEAHAAMGHAKFVMGRGAETEAHMNEAFRLSPRDIFAHRWYMMAGQAKLQCSAHAEAVALFLRGIEANRNFPPTHFFLAAGLALLGSIDQAKAAAKAGLALDPGFTIRRFRLGASGDNPTFLAKREHVCEGMRLAGVPEG